MMWIADFSTLVLIIGAGFILGGIGFFHVDVIEYYFGAGSGFVHGIFAIASLWQLFRQKFH